MSDITPNERYEVAERLRFYADCFDFGDSNPYWYVQKAVFDDTQIHKTYKLFASLADLIDPTCQYLPCVCVTWVDDNGEEHEEKNLEEFGYSEGAYCSVCGYEMMTGEEGWFDYKREEHGNRLIPNFNYCPNCDARVVKDD